MSTSLSLSMSIVKTQAAVRGLKEVDRMLGLLKLIWPSNILVCNHSTENLIIFFICFSSRFIYK